MKIAIYLESYQGNVGNATKELLGAASKFTDDLASDAFGIVIDEKKDDVVEIIKAHGLTSFKVATGVDTYNAKQYANFIAEVAADADVILMPTSTWGHEIGGYLAVKLDATILTDIVKITDSKAVVRSIHSNGVLSTLNFEGQAILTFRGGQFDIPEETGGDASVDEVAIGEKDTRLKTSKIEILEGEGKPLTEADIVIGAGRGVGEKEKMDVIYELAKELDAAVGASRAIVDDGWIETDAQIGQTGKTVSPSLYFALGISGAIQHITGMKTSGVIVAVNTDEEAPIFDLADYGIVEDLHEVVPVLIEKLKNRN